MTPSGVPDAPHTLITGGAGFIGSHLAERLLGQGERVVVIDDFSTGSRDNLASVADDPNLTVIEGTVTGCGLLGSLVAESGYVFHLAAAVGVDLVVQSPIRTIETNLKATEVMLEAAAQGLGIAIMHDDHMRRAADTRLATLFDVDVESPYSYWFVCKPTALEERPVRLFHDWLVKAGL